MSRPISYDEYSIHLYEVEHKILLNKNLNYLLLGIEKALTFFGDVGTVD